MIVTATGKCFDDTAEFLSRLLENGADLRGIFLVHAICIADRDCLANLTPGERYSHAWLEMGDLVVDFALCDGKRVCVGFPREEFYRSRRVQRKTKYSGRQAIREILRHRTYGPWQRCYLDLCADAH